MTIPQLSLLLFALWTAVVPMAAIGWYRWSRILLGQASLHHFRSDDVQGADWYRRAMRAHANSVENLPVFGAIVLCLSLAHVHSPIVDVLSLTVLPARATQSLTHICFVETQRSVSIRFTAFFVQFLCFLILAGYALTQTGWWLH
jgi:uncharacterized MAPEG superfamily protein